MRHFFLIWACSLFLFGCAVTSTHTINDFKKWDKNDSLKWKDFKATPPYSGFDAKIYWEIQYKVDSASCQVYACANKDKSWYKLASNGLLRHEQYHFNIAELFARKARKEIIEKKVAMNSWQLYDILDKQRKACDTVQKEYDKGSSHSKNIKGQQIWEEYVDKQLEKNETFANAAIPFEKPVLPTLINGLTVNEIIDKHITAVGGKERLKNLMSIYKEGIRKVPQDSIKGTAYLTKTIVANGMTRTETQDGDNSNFSMIVNGELWQYYPAKMKKPAKMKNFTARPIYTTDELFDYRAKGYTAKLFGTDTINDQLCYAILLTPKTGIENLFWINMETYMVSQRQEYSMLNEEHGDIIFGTMNIPLTVFEDYRQVDGVMFPFSIRLVFAGTKRSIWSETKFTKIEINKPVDPKLYKPKPL